jgi:hypothetical protein
VRHCLIESLPRIVLGTLLAVGAGCGGAGRTSGETGGAGGEAEPPETGGSGDAAATLAGAAREGGVPVGPGA